MQTRKNLTLKQERFCIHYVDTGNATEAYRRSYNTSKMKPDVINVKASEMLKKGKVAVRIAELNKHLLDKLEVQKEKTLKRLMQGQEFDIRKFYKEDGTIKKPHELDEDSSKAVVGVKYDKDGALLEYKIIDVKGCAELLGKHLKLFTDKVEVEVGDDLKDALKNSDPERLKALLCNLK